MEISNSCQIKSIYLEAEESTFHIYCSQVEKYEIFKHMWSKLDPKKLEYH